ncbi:hypothetical protein [Streptococcus caballi]|uniref:beta-sandwich lipoprotein n=1 Tax=Streptococcus caballi TaxID=439220 RepID=UPI000376DB66|nr:hypothetical protein [Streptococcus caballi]
MTKTLEEKVEQWFIDRYKKHLVNMTKNNMYVVEDVTDGTKVSKYKYEVEYMPKSAIPITVINNE